MTQRQTGRLVRAAFVLALLGVLISLDLLSGSGRPASPPASGVASPQLELAADTSQFRAGNIISDNLFFDGNAMSAGDVQAFLNYRGATCVNGERACLKSFRESTWTRYPDGYCNGYPGAPDETAAWIIAKVGQSCGISQRVLLVLLQKEQSLVSGSQPSARQYAKATGYACPDTAACDSQYSGFYNQVWNAARRFKHYVANFDDYNYRPFRWNTVLYNPDRACGSSPVYIENNATAALYIYTPYQPNGAALAAGYKAAPPCGAYGNRNFWLYYTDWFGSTQSPGGNAVVSRAQAASALLGAATSSVVCGLPADGCFQAFANGSVYWSPATGAQIVRGALGQHWAELGWERSRLGYPTREESCGLRQSGCFQEFQGGVMYWTPGTGAHQLLGAIRNRWNAQKWETGPLGYPTRDEVCGLRNGGCFQAFQGGNVYWSSATGARITSGAVLAKWGTQKWETGPLGYPTTDTTCGLRDSGCYQHFQGGSVYTSATNGAAVVSGAVRTRWAGSGWERGALGYPVGDQRCGYADGGCFQNFENGAVYLSSSTPASIVRTGAVRTAWAAQQYERGSLGYPTNDTTCGLADSGCFQNFQGGAVYTSATNGTHTVSGAVRTRWAAQQWERGPLGYPSGDQTCGLVGGGCSQTFRGGSIYATPATGAHAVAGAFLAAWTAQSAENGALGYPVGEQACGLPGGGCYQHFEKGSIYTSTAGGLRTVLRPIRDAWQAQGWERGRLGYPTGDQVCGLAGGGCSQQFQGGTVSWSTATGAHVVLGAIRGAWVASGSEGGHLGYPRADERCGLVRNGCFQAFQNGSVYWTSTTGAHAVSGEIRDAWGAASWERGVLGYPTSDAVRYGGETTQSFQGGTLVLDEATRQVTVTHP